MNLWKMSETKLKTLLENSKASDAFKNAVQDFADGREAQLIKYSLGSPKVKVQRVLMKLLEAYRNEQISEVDIQGASSCSGYVGTLTFGPNQTKISFNWDCEWKAKQEGFETWYGAPDQIKAASQFGYQCFEKFEVIE